MIQGLQIVIGGDELGRRIGARIREHESKIGALEESYTLSKVDLRLAEMIPPDPDDDDESSTGTLVEYRRIHSCAGNEGPAVQNRTRAFSRCAHAFGACFMYALASL